MGGQREPQLPRGFRDLGPEQVILRKEVVSRIESVFRRFGFDPIETPAVELFEVLAGKYGEEAENKLMWRFRDPWGDREYALRYDLTVPLARYVAMHRGLPMPFKRYQIAPVWRHEEPQRGRYREFYQCDADIVGSPYPEADAEILMLASTIYEELGFRGVRILVNDRRILRGVFEEELGIKEPQAIYRAIDKLDKIGEEGVRRELERLGLSTSVVDRIMEITRLRARVGEAVEELRRRYGSNRNVSEGAAHLEEAVSIADPKGSRGILLDMSLVRGLDYYTGPIFEVVLEGVRIGSIGGGGRYDDLVGLFAGQKIPATGISIGLDRLVDAGLELGIFSPSRRTYAQAYLVVVERSSGVLGHALKVLDLLRSSGINITWDLMRRSQQKQREHARRLSMPLIIYVGPSEASKGEVTIYVTESGERISTPLEKAAEAVKNFLGSS